MTDLVEARKQLSESQLKIQDLEERCERLQTSLDGYGKEWEAREREVREGFYGRRNEEGDGDGSLELPLSVDKMARLGYDESRKGKKVRLLLLLVRALSLDAFFC